MNMAGIHGDLAGDGLGLGDFFTGEAAAFEHIEEVGVTADIELITRIDRHAALLGEFHQDAMRDGGAELRFHIVADDGKSRSLESSGPHGIAADENGDAIDHRHAGFKAGFGIKFRPLLAADREVVHEDGGSGFLQNTDDFFEGGSGYIVAKQGASGWVEFYHVLRDSIGERADIDFRAVIIGIRAEDLGAVGLSEDGLGKRLTDFAGIDIEGAGEMDIADFQVADGGIHQANGLLGMATIERNALHQRRRTISHPHHRHAHLWMIHIHPVLRIQSMVACRFFPAKGY